MPRRKMSYFLKKNANLSEVGIEGRAFADGVEFANVNFTVTTLGVEYLEGVSGEFILSNFPATGNDIAVRWSEPHQNFVIVNGQANSH